MAKHKRVQPLSGCEVLPAMAPEHQVRSHGGPETTRKGSRQPAERASQGRFAELNSFVDVTLRRLSRPESAVWLVLFRDARNHLATVSQASIARRTGVCDRTVRRAIVRLVELRLVKVVRQGRLGKTLSTYRIWPLVQGGATP